MYKKDHHTPEYIISGSTSAVPPANDVTMTSFDPDVDRNECSDELDDFAAPLPGDDDVLSRDHGWGNRGGRLLAKDKRKLREKRRSTGVVKYTAGSKSCHDNDVDEEEEDCDAETSANTSLNETPSADSLLNPASSTTVNRSDVTADTPISKSTSAHSLVADVTAVVTHGDVASTHTCSSAITSLKSNDTNATSHVTDKVEPNIRGILTSRPNPIIAPKPRISASSISQPSTHKPLTSDALLRAKLETKTFTDSERVTLNNRISELEKLLDIERKEKTSLRDELVLQTSKVAELENEVAALNQDLDLADDDFTKLEEENKVLIRAMSRLQSSD